LHERRQFVEELPVRRARLIPFHVKKQREFHDLSFLDAVARVTFSALRLFRQWYYGIPSNGANQAFQYYGIP
jgi:hypothetical protein